MNGCIPGQEDGMLCPAPVSILDHQQGGTVASSFHLLLAAEPPKRILITSAPGAYVYSYENGVLILLQTALCWAGTYCGMLSMANQPLQTAPCVKPVVMSVAALGPGIWAVIWAIPSVGLGVIGLLTKPR